MAAKRTMARAEEDLGTRNQDLISPTVDASDEFRSAYGEYALYTITDRALPDVRDGFKPVHRRILYTMFKSGLLPKNPFKKSATTVGNCLGWYHPHGDTSVYDSMVRMAQDFSLRYPLVEGHGNFGSMDGDSAAAYRYCVAGDTLVDTDRGLVRIDSLAPDAKPCSDNPVSIGVTSRGGKANTADMLFHSGTHPVFDLKLDMGQTLRATGNHPVLVIRPTDKGPELVWVRMDRLSVGDKVAVSRAAATADAPAGVDFPLAMALGGMVAEGFVSEKRAGFNNTDKVYYDIVVAGLRDLIGKKGVYEYSRTLPSGKAIYELDIQSREAVEKLAAAGLSGKAAEKHVPASVLASPLAAQAAFLRALFEGDGSVIQPARHVQVLLSSKSDLLLRQVQAMLLRFGIVSRIYADHPGMGTQKLVMSTLDDIRIFATEIGFLTGKQDRLLRVLGEFPEVTRALSNLDFVPFIAESFRGRYASVAQDFTKHNFDRTTRLRKHAGALALLVDEKDGLLLDEILGGSYYFAAVASITPAGAEAVYSLRVASDCHSFVTNGIVSHNTEARLAPVAMDLIGDIDEDTVDWRKNFDESLDEPVVLPGFLPNLLVNGSAGIAVGMATNMPPHNLREIVKGICCLLDDPKCSVADLMKHVKGPDFPTGGIIVGKDGIKEAYETGRGSITMRAKMHLGEHEGRPAIIITEIPYMAVRSKLRGKIAALIREKSEVGSYLFDSIADAPDLTDNHTPPLKTKIVVKLKKDANPNKVLGLLLKHTPLQQNFGVINLCLVPDENGALVPRVLNLKELMEQYVSFQVGVIQRRSQFRLAKVLREIHLLEGYLVAFQDIDKFVAVVRQGSGKEDVIARLIKAFKVSEEQATALAMLRIYNLSKVDVGDFRRQYDEKKAVQKELEAILKSDARKKALLREALETIANTYGDARRTSIEASDAAATGNYEEAVVAEAADERALLLVTSGGYAKRIPAGFRGASVKAFTLDSGDRLALVKSASTLDDAWFLTSDKNANFLPVSGVPALEKADRGKPLSNLLGSGDAEPRGLAIVPRSLRGSTDAFLVTSSREGLVKRTPLADYVTARTSIQGFVEKGEDRVVGVDVMAAGENLLAVSSDGMTVHFPLVGDPAAPVVPAQGRASAGVGAIKLSSGATMLPLAHYAAADAKDMLLLALTGTGYGRLTAASEYSMTNRNVKGMKTMPLDTAKHGELAVALAVSKQDRKAGTLLCLLASGTLLRVKLSDIPVSARGIRVARSIDIPEGDRLVDAVVEG